MTRQLFDALDPATEAALRASIEKFGVLVPIAIDQDGEVIDGHHRRRIADELGVAFDVRKHKIRDEDHARELAVTLNADRRHLTDEQRRTVVTALREQGHSVRAIAGAVGTSKSTVDRDLSTVPPGTVPERIKGRDGKSRPARRAFRCPDCSKNFDHKVWHCPTCDHHFKPSVAECQNCPKKAPVKVESPKTPALDYATADPHYALLEWRKNFTGSLRKASDFLLFDPEVVAERIAADRYESLLLHEYGVTQWFARLKAARGKALRLVEGGQK